MAFTASKMAACIIAKLRVGWMVEGWAPGVRTIARRLRFHWTTVFVETGVCAPIPAQRTSKRLTVLSMFDLALLIWFQSCILGCGVKYSRKGTEGRSVESHGPLLTLRVPIWGRLRFRFPGHRCMRGEPRDGSVSARRRVGLHFHAILRSEGPWDTP